MQSAVAVNASVYNYSTRSRQCLLPDAAQLTSLIWLWRAGRSCRHRWRLLLFFGGKQQRSVVGAENQYVWVTSMCCPEALEPVR